MDIRVVGTRIERLRRARGWSQKDLATKAGLHKNTVLYLEKGTLRSVQMRTLDALAESLSVDLAQIVESKPNELDSEQ